MGGGSGGGEGGAVGLGREGGGDQAPLYRLRQVVAPEGRFALRWLVSMAFYDGFMGFKLGL